MLDAQDAGRGIRLGGGSLTSIAGKALQKVKCRTHLSLRSALPRSLQPPTFLLPPAHACHKLLVQQNQAYLPGIGVRSVYALSSQPPEDPMEWGTSPEHVRGTEGHTVCAEQGWSLLAAQGSLPFPGTTFTELKISHSVPCGIGLPRKQRWTHPNAHQR